MQLEHAKVADHEGEGEVCSSLITADRLCAKCGYNLIGQIVRREPRYRLLVARCPECGTVAAMQEYPLLGRWAARWGLVIAALWFLLLLSVLVGMSSAVMGMSWGIAYEGSYPLAQEIRQQQSDWQQQQTGGTTTQQPAWMSWWSDLDPNWWTQAKGREILAAGGGWAGYVNPDAYWITLVAGLVMLPFGIFMSVALIHLQRWRAALVTLVPGLGLAAVFLVVRFIAEMAGNSMQVGSKAIELMGVPLLVMGFLACAVSLALSVWFGRPILRLAIRMLLPPRFRGAFAHLWIAEGKRPPAVGQSATGMTA